jgi:hypothetical protein
MVQLACCSAWANVTAEGWQSTGWLTLTHRLAEHRKQKRDEAKARRKESSAAKHKERQDALAVMTPEERAEKLAAAKVYISRR